MLSAQRRVLATLPAAVRHYSVAAPELNISTAKNGVKVASFNDITPTASVAVVVGAGARAEGAGNAGAAHYLKNFGFKNNAKRTAFRITRETELLGGVLSSQLTRESLIFSAEGLKNDVSFFAELLGDVVSKTKFQEHELVDIAHNVKNETAYARSQPEIAVLDEAHRVAFHHGLGNSLFAASSSKIDVNVVKDFARQAFTSGNVALVGSGVSHDHLATLAESFLDVPSGSPLQSIASKYHGGESRIDAEADLGHFLLAYQGAPANTPGFAAAQVLRYVLGGGDRFLKWSAGTSALSHTAAKLSTHTQISAFNLGYSDAGLFGIYVAAPEKDVAAAISAAAEQLKVVTSNITADDYKRAVAQAKFAAASMFETRAERLEVLGNQVGCLISVSALSVGKYTSFADLAAAFDTVKADDVVNIAKKILKSKPTVVAFGDVRALPYADSVSL
ncbi:Metalloenzyme, LuxS/M16 peptidase-like protein [Jimgerdemannia flammicorona]|uniref:Cytochrome b-c1 complex subunit 2, mitochondrial n=1 Tax=Jimgerdemannia flammicorona TaxID=994334 RepID=A0A433QPM6_9FUNG|nr:Metalloenzyme, LuxS/M16 peptidase-like protein [Jimgerdemannia flammicorona]